MIRRIFDILFILVFLAACLLGYAVWIEPFWVRVVHLDVPLPEAHRNLDGLRILHLSDLHFKGHVNVKKTLELSHELKPDLIMITGDCVEEESMIPQSLEFVSKLPKVPIYAVLGNWEHWAKIKVREYRQALDEKNVHLLVNQCVEAEAAGRTLTVGGVDDAGTWYDDMKKTLAACPVGDDYRILLSHSPSIFNELETQSFPLVLAGHCHGGQVRIPGMGPLWLPRGCRNHLYYGLYLNGRSMMNISAGLGTSILPLRFWTRPEVVLIELKAPKRT